MVIKNNITNFVNMSFFNDILGFAGLKVTRISTDDKDYRSEYINGNRQYKANQSNLSFPFDEAYATASDVYAIVNKIARTGKTIPWVLKYKSGDNIDIIEDGEIYDLIQNPNEQQDLVSFVESSLLFLLLGGNVYFNSETPFGMVGTLAVPENVWSLYPQFVRIISKFEGKINKTLGYKYHVDGKEIPISADDIYHIKYANPTSFGINSLYGLSPLTAGYLTLKGLINNQTAHASILDNQGAAGILSNESEHSLTPEERDIQQELFDKKYAGATKLGKIIQSMAKVKYTKLGLDPSQLQIIEGKSLKMRDLCNIYDVSSVLFNDPQNRIQANLIPAETAMWVNAILPNLNIIKKGFENTVLKPINDGIGNGRYYIDLDTSNVKALQKDEVQKATKGKTNSEIIISIITSELTRYQKINALMLSLEISETEATNIIGNE